MGECHPVKHWPVSRTDGLQHREESQFPHGCADLEGVTSKPSPTLAPTGPPVPREAMCSVASLAESKMPQSGHRHSNPTPNPGPAPHPHPTSWEVVKEDSTHRERGIKGLEHPQVSLILLGQVTLTLRASSPLWEKLGQKVSYEVHWKPDAVLEGCRALQGRCPLVFF